MNNLSLIDRFLSPSTSKKFAFAYPRLLLWSVVTLAILVRSLNQGILIPSGYLFAVLPVLLVVFTLQLFGMIAMRVSTSEFFVTVSSLVHIVSAVLLSRSVGVGNSIWGIVLLVEAVILGLTLPLLNGLSLAFISGSVLVYQEVLSKVPGQDVNISSVLVNSGALIAIVFLTGQFSSETRITEEKLEATEEYSAVLLDLIPVSFVSFYESGQLVLANRKAYEVFPELADKPELKGFLPEFDWKKSSFEFSRNEKFYRADLHKRRHPVIKADVYLGLIEDITERRRMEYSLRQSEKLAAIGGLAAGIAHEIRNPLTGISGSIQLLSQAIQSEDDRKLMRIILREIDRLNGLISEFLDFSKPEVPPAGTVELSQLVNEVVSQVRMMKILQDPFKEELEIEDKIKIVGDRDKLKQALLNIFINAVQAMDKGSNNVLFVRLEKNDDEIKLKIRDNGCGMKEDTRKRLFEPFHTTKPKGTGLGLAITHKILESHGAKVFVESELNRGTEFTLSFHERV